MNLEKTLISHLGWLVADVINSNVPQTAHVALEALRLRMVARVLGSSENSLEVAINPVNIVVVECKAHGICQIPSDELPVSTIEGDL